MPRPTPRLRADRLAARARGRAGSRRRGLDLRAFPPLGNMAQLMRGIFFPNSNLIFTVQTRDPGAPAPKPDPAAAGGQTGGFSFVDWGAGIYGGWQLVDNAAIALADASPLMLTPGIRCENGRLAPVTDALWIKLTEQMIAVARKTYQASQTQEPGGRVGGHGRPLRRLRRLPPGVPGTPGGAARIRIRPTRRTRRLAACPGQRQPLTR